MLGEARLISNIYSGESLGCCWYCADGDNKVMEMAFCVTGKLSPQSVPKAAIQNTPGGEDTPRATV